MPMPESRSFSAQPVPPLRTRAAFEAALQEAAEILKRAPEPGTPDALRFDDLLRRISEFDPPPGMNVADHLARRLKTLGTPPADDRPWSPMVGGDLRRPPG